MRKKFIGAFLLGLLALGTAGTITSCKDYDGDISALKNEINTLSSQISTKESTLQSEIAALQTAQANCKTECENARKSLESMVELYRVQLEEGYKSADTAIWTELMDQLEKINALQATDKSLQDAIDALQTSLDTKYASLVEKDAALDAAIQEANIEIGVAKDMAAKAQATADENAEDIAALQTKVSDIATDLAKVKSELVTTTKTANDAYAQAQANAKAIETLQAYDQTLTEKCNELGIEVSAIKDRLALDEAAIETLQKEVADNLAAAKKYTDEEIAKVKASISEEDAKITELQAAYKAADEALQAEITALQEQVNNNYAELVARIATEEGRLKSLVFNPTEYYLGVEAIGLETYSYNAYTVKAANVEEDQVAAGDDAVAAETATTSGINQFTAEYYLNPSQATINTDPTRYTWLSNDAQYYVYSRSGSIATTKKVELVKSQNETNMVKVTARIDASKVQNLGNTNNKLTVLALQYNDPDRDTTITSDFACIRKYTTNNFIISKVNTPGETRMDDEHVAAPTNHLYPTAQAAAEGIAMLDLQYKDQTLDLDDYINIHASVNGNEDHFWGDQDLCNERDFQIVYELIGYEVAGKQQSTAATINGTELSATTGKIAQVGMTPMVRVRLVNTANDNVTVAVGYFKINIVGASNKISDEKEVAYKMSCDENAQPIKIDFVTKDMIEDSLMSYEEFQKYTLFANEKGNAYQFTFDGTNYTKTGATGMSVCASKQAPDSILTMVISNANAYKLFKGENKSASTIVRYDKYVEGVEAPVASIYVTLTIQNTTTVADPTVAFVNETDKVKTTWYAHNSVENGWDELHAHVNEGTTVDNFIFSVAEPNWQANNDLVDPLEIIKGRLDANLVGDLKIAYRFVTPTVTVVPSAEYGADYWTLYVSEDGSKLMAKNADGAEDVVAAIDAETGVITYQHNDIAEDVLNAYGHKDLADAQTITARVKMFAVPCAPLDEISVENGEFDVKFLRPINVFSTSTTIIDADPKTYASNITLSYTDWRDWTPAQFANHTGKNFFDFYGVESIAQDENRDVTTNYLNGGEDFQKIGKLADYFTFTFTQGATPETGTVNYTKVKSLAIHEFVVKLPVVVTYDWGKVYAEVAVTVKPTTGDNSTTAKRK